MYNDWMRILYSTHPLQSVKIQVGLVGGRLSAASSSQNKNLFARNQLCHISICTYDKAFCTNAHVSMKQIQPATGHKAAQSRPLTSGIRTA